MKTEQMTNKHHLPDAVVQAIANNYFDPSGQYPHKIGVTTLLDSPYVAMLKNKYFEEIEFEASDMMWSLLGSSVHAILEKSSPSLIREFMASRKVTIDGGGKPYEIEIVGVVDSYDPVKKELIDYKITSKYAVNNEERIGKYRDQVRINAWLLEGLGFEVNTVGVFFILRDFVLRDAYKHDMPKTPFASFMFDHKTDSELESFIQKRATYHFNNDTHCSEEERWAKPAVWAVIKEGSKRAFKLFNSNAEAQNQLRKMDGTYRIEIRPGTDVRCQSYCGVKKFCHYYLKKYGGVNV